MKLTPASQEKIAETLALGLPVPVDARQPPIDPKGIANHFGIDVETGAAGADGHLLRLKGKTIIQVSGRRSPVQRRFTIAHELGHFAIGKVLENHKDSELANRLSQMNSPIEEVLCNKFAAFLLLPTEWLRSKLSTTPVTAAQVKQIAVEAQTSFETAAWRLLDAGLGVAGFGIVEAAEGVGRWDPLMVPGIRTGYLKAPLTDAPALHSRATGKSTQAMAINGAAGLPGDEPLAIKLSNGGRILRGFATGTNLGEQRTGICFTTSY